MSGYVIKTELYKIFSKKYIFAVAAFFVVFVSFITVQSLDSVEVRYPLTQFMDVAAQMGQNNAFIQKAEALNKKWQTSEKGIDAFSEDMKELLPESIVLYTEQFRGETKHGISVADILNEAMIDEIRYYRARLDDRRAETEKLKSELDSMQNKGETGSFAYKTAEREYQLYETAPAIEPNLTNWEKFVDLNQTYLPLCIAFLVILGLCGIYSDEYSNKKNAVGAADLPERPGGGIRRQTDRRICLCGNRRRLFSTGWLRYLCLDLRTTRERHPLCKPSLVLHVALSSFRSILIISFKSSVPSSERSRSPRL